MKRANAVLFGMALSLLTATVSAADQDRPAEELYTQYCAICHLPGIAGAPKVGDQAEWNRRVRAGLSALYRNAIQGIPNTAMMPNGGARDIKATELKAVVDYMITAAKLTPEMLAAAASYDRRSIANRDFIRLDANFDGALTRNEVAGDAVLLKNFGRFDTDADGRWSVGEYENAETVLEQERKAATVEDRIIASSVRAALARVKGIDLDNTKIEVVGGVVSMIGIVAEPSSAIQAHDGVKRIPGVQRIDNRLVSGHQMGWD